jgi:hypothetical protein
MCGGAFLGLGGVSCQLGPAAQDIKNLIKAAFYARPRDFFPSSASGDPDSSKGGAVETGRSGSHYIIGCFII